ncbi:pilus assembly protein TadG-related protein [Thermomonas brevis]|uniref:pilus assembly protein TadG-related protein n=1 Tax=Thermomonas brevis TaxID=215691 RepID=UPI001FE9FED7|nr:pilus assembly protein TadG-related protein [Thermomonas brevis]
MQRLASIHRGRQQGQALPLVLVLLIVLCIGLLVTFNTGQVVGRKVEVTNAADAAAYSIAVEQARARNLAAYLNRGRVANEVAIAQMVSLNSWLTMVHSTSYHFEKFMDVVSVLLSWVPGLGEVLIAIDRAMTALNKALKGFRNAFIPGVNAAIGTLDQVFDHPYALAASAALSVPATEANVFAMASKVVRDNAPDAEITSIGRGVLAKNVYQAASQLEHYKMPGKGQGLNNTNAGAERYRNVVMASRDTFTRAREGTAFGVFRNRGGTDLVEYDRWAAVDVFEFHLPLPWPLDDVDFPLGWGGTQAVNGRKPNFFPGMRNGRGWKSPYDNRTYAAYNGTSRGSISGRFIEGDPAGQEMGFKRDKAYLNQYRHGLNLAYDDVKQRDAKHAYSEIPEGADAGPIYTVEVGMAIAAAPTSSALGIGAGRMALKDEARHDQIRAMASAQVYFNRPHEYSPFRRSVWGRSDGKFEMGNMFSPYWQARLVATPDMDRRLLVGAP